MTSSRHFGDLLKRKLAAGKRSVGPIIATVLLVSVAIVMALVAEVYSISIVGSSVLMITVKDTNMYSGSQTSPNLRGTANLEFVVTNPGQATTISSIIIDGAGLSSTPEIYQCSGPNSCTPLSFPAVPGGSTTSFDTSSTSFFIGAPLNLGQTFGYSITFGNGQSVSGSAIAD